MPKSNNSLQSKVALFTVVVSLAMLIGSDAQGLEPSQSNRILVSQRENCLDYDRDVQPSSNQRMVELSQLGISVQIPENYRALLRNSGEVWILNPVDYDIILCTLRGGAGGRGLYAPTIKSISNPSNLSLNDLAINSWGSASLRQPYDFSGLTGLLVQSGDNHQGLAYAAFFVQIPGVQDVVEISATCDCDITADDITSFLNTVNLLE
ncbi:MAG: hypothetical protein AAFX01_12900 [Cyanobacteria bacterium J06638_28]